MQVGFQTYEKMKKFLADNVNIYEMIVTVKSRDENIERENEKFVQKGKVIKKS